MLHDDTKPKETCTREIILRLYHEFDGQAVNFRNIWELQLLSMLLPLLYTHWNMNCQGLSQICKQRHEAIHTSANIWTILFTIISQSAGMKLFPKQRTKNFERWFEYWAERKRMICDDYSSYRINLFPRIDSLSTCWMATLVKTS